MMTISARSSGLYVESVLIVIAVIIHYSTEMIENKILLQAAVSLGYSGSSEAILTWKNSKSHHFKEGLTAFIFINNIKWLYVNTSHAFDE